jgi:hypothetical protein
MADLRGVYSGPIAPPGAALRWAESSRRRRLLEGYWADDLRARLADEYGPTRRRRLGVPDTTKNLFRSVVTQLAILYDREPILLHDDPAAVELMTQITRSAGLWQLAKTMQQQALGLREAMYRVDVRGEGDEAQLLVRVVPVDIVHALADPDDPDTPHTVYEYRLRDDAAGHPRWTRDCVTVQGVPSYRIEDQEGRETLQDLGTGDAYPYTSIVTGDPVLPYVLYHATRTGRLWDAKRGVEIVDGTLTIGALWTQWRSMVRDASWPQRWAVNAQVQGITADGNGDMWVETDEGSLLQFGPRQRGESVQIGQFEPGGDPKVLGEAIRAYASDLAADFDIAPADIRQTHNGADGRSGYAIEISRDGQRHAQRRYEPQFRRGDVQLLGVIATLWNVSQGAQVLPEDGWGIEYPGLPLSMEERRLLLEQFDRAAELGITSRPALLAKLEGITEDQARERLRVFVQDEREFGASTRGPTR